MPKGQATKYTYECPFHNCGKGYTAPIAISDFPWCPSTSHTRQMDFIEGKSTKVPDHVLERQGKAHRKQGGNFR